MDVQSLVKIFKLTLYAMLAFAIVAAGVLIALIFAILKWTS